MIRKTVSVALAASLTLGLSPIMSKADYNLSKTNATKEKIISKLGLDQDQKVEANQFQKGTRNEFDDKTLVIKYSKAISAAAHNQAGGKLIQRVPGLNYDVIEVKNGKKLEEAAKEYAQIPGVLSVSRSAKIQRLGSPDLKAGDMYNLKTLKVDEASKLAGTNKVRVAVIDGGVDAKHPELKNKITGNFNTMDPIKKGAPDSHGTHVAGIIAAEKNNGIGGYGINPNANIISIDVFNRSPFASDYTIAQGILQAIEQKAQVINMSLGTSYRSPILEEAVKKAVDANITVVAAAGNSGVNTLGYPAAFEGVISVGSTNSKNELSVFSTFGPSVDVVAPGEAVYSPIYDIEKGSSFAKMSGTSMASPAVAGVASLLLSKNPKLTPYEVTYILQNSSTDLGSKGYDIKFGYGLVNPVAALKFDTKKIPKNPAVQEKDILSAAKKVDTKPSVAVSGAMTKLNQTDYYKLNVKKGELIQTKLDVSKNYDYQIEYRFYPENETAAAETQIVNDQKEGLTDGALYEAPENGVLVIGIKDANGNYSENSLSKYSLIMDRSDVKLKDENTAETPVVINSLPFTSGSHYFTDEQETVVETPEGDVPSEEETGDGEEPIEEEPVEGEEPIEEDPLFEEKGDSDFFKLKFGEVKPGEISKITLTGVSGINSSIKLHIIEEIEGNPEQYELDMADQNGFGMGEELIFQPIANTEYVIEVTNKPVFDPFFFFFFGEMEIDLTRNFSSQMPYQVSLESKVLPEDEDGFPMSEMIPEEALEEGNIEEFYKRKNAMIERMEESQMMFENEYANMVMEAAKPYEARQLVNGYLQYNGDEDWFVFTPEEDAVYEFNFVGGSNNIVPMMEFYQYNETIQDFTYISSNVKITETGFGPSAAFRVGLKSGQTYYFNAVDMNYRASDKPYRFSSKAILNNISDEFELNDVYEEAKPLGTTAAEGNYSSAGDLDIFYFTPKKDGLYGYVVEPLAKQPYAGRKVPQELYTPIDPVVVVIEDSNKNNVLDPEEEGKYIFTDYGFENDEERGSLNAKAQKGYFVVTFNYYTSVSSLMPYQLKMIQANQTDEDKGSVIKNNVPSKPIALKKTKDSNSAQGYFNASTSKGDVDFYKLTVDQQKKMTLSLKTPSDADGVVTLYDAKGKQLARVDHYGINDQEFLPLNLKKGIYYIKVEEAAARASVSPYQLVVKP